MDNSLEIISALSSGINPHTGETYPDDSPYHHPQVLNALLIAKEALARNMKTEARKQKLPNNAGKAWDSEEHQRFVTAFNSGKTTKELAVEHGRTEGAICARLIKLGKLELQLSGGRISVKQNQEFHQHDPCGVE